MYPGNTYDIDPYNKSTKAQIYNSMYGKGNCYDMTVDCNTRGIDEICSAADNFCYNEVEDRKYLPGWPSSCQKARPMATIPAYLQKHTRSVTAYMLKYMQFGTASRAETSTTAVNCCQIHSPIATMSTT